MLGNHSDCIALPESQFIPELIPRSDPRTPVDSDGVIAAIERHWRFRIWNFDLRGARPAPGGGLTYAATIRWLVQRYAEARGKASAGTWIDQTPQNLLWATRLDAHFPDARFIHIVRDGRAVAASVLPLSWGPNTIQEAADEWMRKLAFGLSLQTRFGPERVMLVRFEDLVQDSEATMRRLAGFLGLPFDAAMLEPRGLELPAYTQAQHRLIGSSPDRRRIDAWRTALTERQIEIFEGMTADLLTYHGYPLAAGPHPRPASPAEKLSAGVRSLLGRANHKLVLHRRRRAALGA